MTTTDHIPPPDPPSFLTQSELLRLAQHGHLAITLPGKLQNDVTAFFSAIDTFFQLPDDKKAALYPGTAANLEEGYHQVPDEKQFLSLRHANGNTESGITSGHAEVENRLRPLWHDISHLLFRILFDIGRFLGIDNDAWFPLVRRGLTLPLDSAASTPSLLRAFRYQPDKGISEPHLDVGLLTLCLGKGKGLELWERNTAALASASASASSSARVDTNGRASAQEEEPKSPTKPADPQTHTPVGLGWRDAAEVTILVGETLRVLSTNRVWAGLHRVVPNAQGRDSLVFALRPDLDTTLDLALFGGAGHVPARTLWEMIRKGKYNVNAEKEVREEVKARNRSEKEKEQEMEREREMAKVHEGKEGG